MRRFFCLLKAADCSFKVLIYCLGFIFVSVSSPHIAYGNDSAAAVAAGGIQLIRQELISMEKEELFISTDKITVAYEFRNLSDKDIPTEVSFPIPEFREPCMDPNQNHRFDDFKVFVDGKPVSYKSEIKAMVNGKDVTSILHEYKIQPETFGGYICDEIHGGTAYTVSHMSAEQIKKLTELGIILDDKDYPSPQWSVVIKYHWTQTFPAHKTISIRHEYKPLTGFQFANVSKLLEQYKDSCLEESDISNRDNSLDSYSIYPIQWVKYILTTANTWKTPINDFTMRIEPPKKDMQIKFCWDGPVEVNENGEATVHVKNFIPKNDLVVIFLPFKGATKDLLQHTQSN